MHRVMRKPAFFHAKNEGADQLHSDCAADQHLCFRYIDSTNPYTFLKFEFPSLWSSAEAVQTSLSRTFFFRDRAVVEELEGRQRGGGAPCPHFQGWDNYCPAGKFQWTMPEKTSMANTP